jgi:hypothetical protein
MNGKKRSLLNHRRAVGFVLILFLFSVVVRLPNLNRPLSKHYEFNTAVALINIISWRQAGGGNLFQYTPVMNFQHSGDKMPPNHLNIDKNGNWVYLSYGPGWYTLAYFMYQLFHLPPVPIYLELLNLVFHIITVLLFYYLLAYLIPDTHPSRYMMILAGCSAILFSPGPIWFLGNCYVNVGIMLPFVLGVFLLVVPMLQDPDKIQPGILLILALLIIILVYLDWYILCLSFMAAMGALIKIRHNRKYAWLLMVIILSVLSGVSLIFLQFSSHMGKDAVFNYWLHRFSVRSLNTGNSTLTTSLAYYFAYFLSSFLPLILLLLIGFLYRKKKKIPFGLSRVEVSFIVLSVSSLILYNFILFNWSSEHEFSVLPWCFLLAYLFARLTGLYKNQKMAAIQITVLIVFSVGQYYWINRPGHYSRDGLAFNSFKLMGESLKEIPPDHTIFMNMEQNPMVEYYAGRNILRSPVADSVKNISKMLGVPRAVWVDQKDYQVRKIQIIQ